MSQNSKMAATHGRLLRRDKCSCSIINYLKTYSIIINMQKKTHLVIFGWVFTRSNNLNNKNWTKLEPFKASFKIPATDNEKKLDFP